jgi:NarL family two-component system response regulator LiaR
MMSDMPKAPIRILVAEDHELSRNGLIFSLQKKTDMVIVGDADNGQTVVELALAEKPDVILMDIGMPVMDGIEAAHQVKAKLPETKIIMLTSHQEGEEIYAALAAGAEAYCLKDIKIDRLIQVIEMVYEGAIWLDPGIGKLVMQALPLNIPDRLKSPSHRQKYNVDLTERELEVLGLIVGGKSNKEIADELCITVHTAKAHVCNIIQKLAVDDRTQAAVKALRDGLVKHYA